MPVVDMTEHPEEVEPRFPQHQAIPEAVAQEAGLISPPSNYLWLVPISQLRIDHDTQRTMSKSHPVAGYNPAPYDESAVQPVEVIYVDGKLYIIDGQHTLIRAKEEGYTHLVARVHYNLSKSDRAKLFIKFNRERSNVSARWLYHVGQAARLREYVETEKVLRKHNAWVKRPHATARSHAIYCPSTLAGITDRSGPVTLDRTLTIVENAWPGSSDRSRYQAWLLRAISNVVDFGADQEKLTKMLKGDYPGLISEVAPQVGDLEALTPELWAIHLNQWVRRLGLSMSSGNRDDRMASLLITTYNRYCSRSTSTQLEAPPKFDVTDPEDDDITWDDEDE